MLKRFIAGLLALCLFVPLASADQITVVSPVTVRTLCASGAAVSAPADTNEDTLATCLVPGGTLGANGTLRITTLWTTTNSVNNKVLRTKLGATAYGAVTSTTTLSYREQRQIQNRNATNSQVAWVQANGATFGSAAGANVTGSIDTTTDQSLTITCQKATAGETCTLESYTIEFLAAP